MPEHADTRIGARLQELRKRRGLSQRELAETSRISLSTVRKLEQGEQKDTRMETARKLAAALRVKTTQLLDRVEEPQTSEISAGDPDLWRPVQKAVELPVQQPSDAEPPAAAGIAAAVDDLRQYYFADHISSLAESLPLLLRDADALGASHDDRLVRARLLHLTAAALTQVRHFAAAEVALDRAEDDAPDAATSAGLMGTRCWLLLRQGHLSRARELATRWADDLEPRRISRATAEDLAVWGWALLNVAAGAVRDNRSGEASDALRLARGAAALTGRDLQYGNRLNRWGPVEVAQKRAEHAMILDQPDRVLEIAAGLRGRQSGTDSNSNRHRLDVAHAHTKLRHYGEAMDTLLEIRQSAPEWLSHQQYARDILTSIIAKRRTLTPEMRHLADAIQLPL